MPERREASPFASRLPKVPMHLLAGGRLILSLALLNACGTTQTDISTRPAQANPQGRANSVPSIPEVTPTFVPLITKISPTATEAPQPGPTPKPFKIGDTVAISGTSPECLYVRVAPGTSADTAKGSNGRNMCLPDGTKLVIQGGPVSQDGYNWWQNRENGGWSVDTYLTQTTAEPTSVRGGTGRLARVNESLMDKTSRPFAFDSVSGPFTLDIPSSWRPGRPDVPAYGRLYKNYQTYTVFEFLRRGVFARLEDLKDYEEQDLNSDIVKYGRGYNRSTTRAVVSKERVAGYDAYLISGTIPNGSALYNADRNQSGALTDVEVNMLTFMVGDQGYRFALMSHPEITQQELPNFSKMMNSFRVGDK